MRLTKLLGPNTTMATGISTISLKSAVSILAKPDTSLFPVRIKMNLIAIVEAAVIAEVVVVVVVAAVEAKVVVMVKAMVKASS